ncbi:hypothetical protein BDZ89DRAFT_1056495, partial [Hymenopellis radicata]
MTADAQLQQPQPLAKQVNVRKPCVAHTISMFHGFLATLGRVAPLYKFQSLQTDFIGVKNDCGEFSGKGPL